VLGCAGVLPAGSIAGVLGCASVLPAGSIAGVLGCAGVLPAGSTVVVCWGVLVCWCAACRIYSCGVSGCAGVLAVGSIAGVLRFDGVLSAGSTAEVEPERSVLTSFNISPLQPCSSLLIAVLQATSNLQNPAVQLQTTLRYFTVPFQSDSL
jgi:hypothetical protein